ncbi:MAG TPA: trigger factor [Acholeplasmataceae bacterium]|nr:trigger factor [Acholeplasmataceae bacterium]
MKVEKLSSNRVKYTFNVSVDEFEHGLEYAYNGIKDEVEVKGFRKGHVTRKVYEQKFGVQSLYEEALNHVLHHKFHDAVNHGEYQLVGEPKVDLDFSKVQTEQPFEVSFEVAVKPDVELGEYKGVLVDKLDDSVTDEEVLENIDGLLNQNVNLVLKNEGALENGDTAIFDFEGFKDDVAFEGGKAENYELEIGSNQFIPGFEEQMVGMNVGEEKSINVTFPEQYQAEELAGQDAVFNVKLHEIKIKAETELTDEWVASLSKEGVNTVEELKASIRKDLEDKKANENKNKTLDQALKTIAEASTVDIPEEMIENEVNNALTNIENQAKQYGLDMELYISLTGMTEEQLKEQLRADANVRILNSLIIEEIAKKENFEVSADEIKDKYQELADTYNLELDQVKAQVTDELIKNDISFSKAIEVIVTNLKYN